VSIDCIETDLYDDDDSAADDNVCLGLGFIYNSNRAIRDN